MRAAFSRYSFSTRRQCPVCQHYCRSFLPYMGGFHSQAPLSIALEMVGSNLEEFECPWCGSSDRERHLYLFMDQAGMFTAMRNWNILHFAPERNLSRHIQAQQPAGYLRADLYPSSPDVQRVDITSMDFPDASFDLLMANHVMEHVYDEAAALKEIFRVIKPGGYMILQTPYSPVLHRTWSDPGITTDLMRFHAHGQEDHVRTYGRDIFDRFSGCGANYIGCEADLPGALLERAGVNLEEPFFLYQRPAEA